ncbi:hypothetical protein B4102_2704 [Heyndrickxia sporothermodurans]|uniref:Lysine-N-methylase n=1 Tax=Heyndrickxia sporothermodurans TaxID=46224 RepID=A0A150LA39_9BACI|nr:flagellin lysine-N-methylase [Heyndrickxia sporothermodurans]KYD09177.1 hypothetical protein B4102_2704 [Heyndrickxia sporothermodurans]
MNRNYSTLYPEYIKHFSCIGSECEDTCCAGWKVTIDKNTYKKYKKVKNKSITSELSNAISRNRSNPNDGDYAYIKMDEEGNCPFLTCEKLCSIHGTLGESYLSETCAVYPRSYNMINGVIEKTATLSCPEVTRLAILNPNGIAFEQTMTEKPKRGTSINTINTGETTLFNQPVRFFEELRSFSIEVIQNRCYALSERIIYLGLFLNNIQNAIDQHQIDQIPNIISKYKKLMLDTEQTKQTLTDIPTNFMLQMKICKELVDFRTKTSINNKRYLECLTEMLIGLAD